MVAAVLIPLAAIAFMLMLSVRTAQHLPPDGEIPVHFDLRGKPDKFGPRWITLGILPGLYLIFGGFLTWLTMGAPAESWAEQLVGLAFTSLVVIAVHGWIMALLMKWVKAR